MGWMWSRDGNFASGLGSRKVRPPAGHHWTGMALWYCDTMIQHGANPLVGAGEGRGKEAAGAPLLKGGREREER
jgi:hypothetical protein